MPDLTHRAAPSPPVPSDEAARLQALAGFHVLDTPPELAYDDLTALAADICGTPMALLSLVDENRQWFKSRQGVEVAQTPRDIAFCAHAILKPHEVLLVPDATLDTRFRANPLVTGDTHLRFYAGAPLLTADDRALGTLCVLDTEPRALDHRQIAALEALSRQAVAQLELRRQLIALARAEQDVRRSEGRFRHLSMHDPLTELPNRGQLQQRLADLDLEVGVGVVYLDLDGFKAVNDTLGHGVGDAVLVETARRLRSTCGKDDLPIRLGGDEFVVLTSPATPRGLELLRARLVDAISAPQVHTGHTCHVTSSAGTALSPAGAHTDREERAGELLRRADEQMYQSKRGTARGRAPRSRNLHAQLELREAIAQGRITTAYQPLWEVGAPGRMADARLIGVEALARWHHPVRGLVPPAEFITLAEETGVIADLGRSVLRSAARDLIRWQQRCPVSARFTVHVNVAGEQLHAGELGEELVRVRDSTGVDLRNLCLEVTESSLLDAQRFRPEDAQALVDLGVGLALDDFGTGFSSLTQLRTYPFDTVKIDRSFVTDCETSVPDRAIVRSVIELASTLGMQAVAEGIETPGQLQALSALGCTRFQGFLLGRPLGPADIAALFQPMSTVPLPRAG